MAKCCACALRLLPLTRANCLPAAHPHTACLPALRCSYLADQASGRFAVHHGVIQKRKGSGPNEPGSFQLVDHFALPTTVPSRQQD